MFASREQGMTSKIPLFSIHFFRVISRRPGIILACAVIGIFLLLALLAPVIAPHDPDTLNLRNRLDTPSAAHPFGTDAQGRDVLSRVIFGTRASLAVGLLAPAFAFLVGTVIGLTSGYVGGPYDTLVMRGMDLLKAFPLLLMALFILALMGNRFELVVIAIGIAMTPDLVRLVRAHVLVVKTMEYVQAARAMRFSHPRILLSHILPAILGPMIVYITLGISQAVLIEAALGFLGFGVPTPRASWGNIMSGGMAYIRVNPWLAIGPALALIALVLSVNTLGEYVRQIYEPGRHKGFLV